MKNQNANNLSKDTKKYFNTYVKHSKRGSFQARMPVFPRPESMRSRQGTKTLFPFATLAHSKRLRNTERYSNGRVKLEAAPGPTDVSTFSWKGIRIGENSTLHTLPKATSLPVSPDDVFNATCTSYSFLSSNGLHGPSIKRKKKSRNGTKRISRKVALGIREKIYCTK